MLKKLIRTLILMARNAWLAVGILILCFVFLNGLCTLLIMLATGRPGDLDWQMKAEAWRNVPWVRGYYKELLLQRGKWFPYVYWRQAPFVGQYINHDEQGLRRTWNPSLRAGTKEVHIFVFGGSTLEGNGARDDYTIPSALSKLLAASKYPVQVTNFGQGGYVSTQDAIALLLELRRGNVPDIVIFYDGANEIYSAIQSGKAGIPLNEMNRVKEFNLLNKSRRKALLAESVSSIVQQSSMGRVLRFLVKMAPGKASAPSDKLARDAVDSYKFNTQWVENLARWKHFQPLFYWQPLLYTKQFLSPYERKLYDKEESVKGFRRFCLKVDADIENDKELTGDPHFQNISHLLDDFKDPLFLDYCHISEAGNEMIARRMFVDVVNLLKKKT